MHRMVLRSAKKLNADPTNYNFLKNAVSFLIFIVVIIIVFYSIPELKSIGVSLLASAGILAAIVGFASQQAFSNIVSGIFVVIFKPFRVGDYIKIGDFHFGTVEDITLRHTVIKNPENRRVIIPNSVISSETILNSSIADPKVCAFVEIGISYFSSIDAAISIMRSEAENHPNLIDTRSETEVEEGVEKVVIRVIQLADSSVVLRAYVWAENTGKAFVMKCDLLKSIKESFEKNDIEIPFPHQTLYLRKDENKN
ncbi:mechanosensitive ion channel protein MscS [Marinifilum breve]|uniref:Mechanosensitive ion channel protein MscS n=2 Tax=Marinifilum breve TaxID=2184082 RepID=A0A2V3ZRU7_9BACT|nr:mechanosensitive ion channel protein MscS [Marinifilum breve]